MVKDAEALTRIRDSWRTVRTVDAMIRTNLNAGIFSLVPSATGFSQVPESLLLVFAVSVLEDTLRQLRDEGAFSCQRNELSRLMKASQTVLPWRDFAKVEEVRERRNRVAHRREFLAPGQCASDLSLLAQELVAWGVLARDAKVEYRVNITPSS